MTDRNEKLQTKLEGIDAKLNKLAEERAGVVAELEALALITNIQNGDVVVFGFGRKADRQELTGTVLATVEDPIKGKVLRVFAGEGMEASTYTVAASAVVRVVQPEPVAQAVDSAAA